MYIYIHAYNFTTIVIGHGKTRAYLHRFKILENTTFLCNKGNQTVDHLINQCTLLQTQTELLRNNVLKSGTWPVRKEQLIMKTLEIISYFHQINRL
jgi:hypothetical protein